jgi:hypothetical protein
MSFICNINIYREHIQDFKFYFYLTSLPIEIRNACTIFIIDIYLFSHLKWLLIKKEHVHCSKSKKTLALLFLSPHQQTNTTTLTFKQENKIINMLF